MLSCKILDSPCFIREFHAEYLVYKCISEWSFRDVIFPLLGGNPHFWGLKHMTPVNHVNSLRKYLTIGGICMLFSSTNHIKTGCLHYLPFPSPLAKCWPRAFSFFIVSQSHPWIIIIIIILFIPSVPCTLSSAAQLKNK